MVKNLKDEDGAKDMVQDTFLKLWTNKDEVNPEKVKSWLFSTAYRGMIDKIRRDKKMVSSEEQIVEHEMTENNYSDLNEVLHEALNKLPEKQKSVILLRDYEGYSYKEISDITEMSESQVKVYIYRARLFLQKYIGSPEAVL